MKMTEKLNIVKGYNEVLDSIAKSLESWESKTDALSILSGKMSDISADIDRNDLLDIRQKLNDLKSQHDRCNVSVKGCMKWANNAIMLRLKEEELDNYSRNGKLFYPSVQTYVSVADRVAVNEFAAGQNSFDIFGNTLNKEYVLSYLEESGELPPGITSYQRARLNVRSKT